MSLRVSTAQMFDRPTALMATLSQQADALQAQVATGKRIVAPSDDPVAYAQLGSLKRAGAADTAYAANVKLAQGLLAQTDSTLDSVKTQLQRAQELAIQASNGTLTDANRAAITTELGEITADLVSLANTRDARGTPLFGGATGDTAYVRPATAA
ncbi:MAG: flagellar hook-associated protein FlgL [Sphingomonas sp.]